MCGPAGRTTTTVEHTHTHTHTHTHSHPSGELHSISIAISAFHGMVIKSITAKTNIN